MEKVTTPLIGEHSWRQADTAAVARNYHREGYRIFYPQVDWRGDGPGYAEMEFPLYSFVLAVSYKLGAEWVGYGRILSALASVIGLLYFYRLVVLISDRATGLWAILFSAILPLNIFYSRTIMPDATMLSLSIVGVYYFVIWLESRHWSVYATSVVCVSIACLLKITALYLGLPLLYLAWSQYGWRVLRRLDLWSYAFIVLVAVAAWYYHAHELGRATGLSYGIWGYGTDKWGNWDLVASLSYWNKILHRSLLERYLAWGAVPLFILGLALPRRTRRVLLFDVWLVAVLIYFIVVAGGNFVHEYYQLAVTVPAAYFVGAGAAWLGRRPLRRIWPAAALAACLAATLVSSRIRLETSYFYREGVVDNPLLSAAEVIASHTASDQLVVVATRDPTLLYLIDRKGWRKSPSSVTPAFLRDCAARGARYFVGYDIEGDEHVTEQVMQDLIKEVPLFPIYDGGHAYVYGISVRP